MRRLLDRGGIDREIAQLARQPAAGAENPGALSWRRIAWRERAGFERARRLFVFETRPNHPPRAEFLRPQSSERHSCARKPVQRACGAVNANLSCNSPE